MRPVLLRIKHSIYFAIKPYTEAVVGVFVISVLRVIRYLDDTKVANLFGRALRLIGPMRREQRIGRANLMAAFPEKSRAEINRILAGVWDNIGRVSAEFAHLDKIWDYNPDRPESGRVELSPRSEELFIQLRDDGKPALIFASHLGSWEMPAIAAFAYGLDSAILYRRPNIASVDRVIRELRAAKMGTLVPGSLDAPMKLAQALQNGQHVALLVDQYFGQGVEVTFFGRKTKANPILARLLRQVECPIHGVRIIRLPNHRYRAELSEEVKPVRDANGQIDIQGTMQAVTSVVEDWVREYPDQWLWLHRRWR